MNSDLRHSFFSFVDSYGLQIATIFLVAYLLSGESSSSNFLRIASSALVVCASLNSLIALSQLLGLSPTIFYAFWSSPVDVGSEPVGFLAFGNYRFSGLINQPAEAGAIYAAALGSIYLVLKLSPAVQFSASCLVLFGGFACGSKVFLVMLPVVVAGIFLRNAVLREKLRTSLILISAGLLILVAMLPTPIMNQTLERLYVRQTTEVSTSFLDSFLYGVTAGRIGNGGSLTIKPIDQIVTESYNPEIAKNLEGAEIRSGAPGTTNQSEVQNNFDSAWPEVYFSGGTFGVIFLLIMFFTIFIGSLVYFWKGESSFYPLFLAITALFGSIGFGALTANRWSTIFWTLMTIALLSRYSDRTQRRPSKNL